MKLNRYQSINSLLGSEIIEVETQEHKTGKRCVDESNFQPMAETIRTLSQTAPITKEQYTSQFNSNIKAQTMKIDPLIDTTIEIRKQQENIKKQIEEQKELNEKKQKYNLN